MNKYYKHNPKRDLVCLICSKPFQSGLPNAKYCSKECRKVTTANPYTSPYSGGISLPTGTSGAISELRVCCDLLIRGFEVFRAVSPSCSCDLAILKNKQLLRIEVRTGYIHSTSGKRSTAKPHDPTRFDVMAVAYADSIIYTPPLAEM